MIRDGSDGRYKIGNHPAERRSFRPRRRPSTHIVTHRAGPQRFGNFDMPLHGHDCRPLPRRRPVEFGPNAIARYREANPFTTTSQNLGTARGRTTVSPVNPGKLDPVHTH